MVVLAAMVRAQWPALRAVWAGAALRPGWLAVSAAAVVASHAIYSRAWQELLQQQIDAGAGRYTNDWMVPPPPPPAVPRRVRWVDVQRLLFVGDAGYFLPLGKAWQLSILASLSARVRAREQTVVGTSLVLSLSSASGAALLGVVAFALSTAPALGAALLLAVAAAGAGAARVLAGPGGGPARVPRFAAKAARGPLAARWRGWLATHMPGRVGVGFVRAVGWSTLSWACYAAGVVAMQRGVLPASAAWDLAHACAVVGIANTAGVLVPVMPAGLGVRDLGMVAVAGGLGIPGAGVLATAAAERVWVGGVETCCILLSCTVLWTRRRLPAGRLPAG